MTGWSRAGGQRVVNGPVTVNCGDPAPASSVDPTQCYYRSRQTIGRAGDPDRNSTASPATTTKPQRHGGKFNLKPVCRKTLTLAEGTSTGTLRIWV